MSIWWCCCGGNTGFVSGFGTYGHWEPSGTTFNNRYLDSSARPLIGFGVDHNPFFPFDQKRLSSYVRWTNVTIPNGATIVSAKMTIDTLFSNSAFGHSSGSANCDIAGEDADDATTLTSASQADGLTRSSATVAYSHSIGDHTSGDAIESPSITSIVQEIVNRTGWSSGNALQVLFDEDGTSSSAGDGSEFGYGVLANFTERVISVPFSPKLVVEYA